MFEVPVQSVARFSLVFMAWCSVMKDMKLIPVAEMV